MAESVAAGNQLNGVQCLDAQTGWAVGNAGTILKTSNGRRNWISQCSGTTNNLSSGQFIDSHIGWVVGDGGTILQSTNGGSS